MSAVKSRRAAEDIIMKQLIYVRAWRNFYFP